MDELGLTVLNAELKEDCRVIAEAARLSQERFNSETEAQLEATAYHLSRLYNAVEQMGLRIAKAFENHIDDEQGWHAELIRRLSLEIPSIRPVFFPQNMLNDLRELRGFRHVVRHAYELTLDPDKLKPVIKSGERVADRLPQLCHEFLKKVAESENWHLE